MSGGQVMVVLIVLIAVIGSIFKKPRDRRGPMLPSEAGPNPEADRLRDEVTMLKDRIAVLERVITDNHTTNDLDRQIEKLRDRS